MRSTIFVLFTVFLGACATQDIPDQYPEGTVRVGPNSFMVPVGETDSDGCQAYQRQGPGQFNAAVVHYQRADGTFTVNKQEAACMGN